MIRIRSVGAKVKLLQQQLNKLGYRLAEDGLFGLNTLRAVRDFQLNSDIAVDGIVGHFTEMALFNALNKVTLPKPSSAHFSYDEFICNSDKDAMANGIPHSYWQNIQTIMDRLEQVRMAVGNLPIVIRSGYRSPAYNKAVSGAKKSQHLYGKAVDIYIKGRSLSCASLANIIYFNDALKTLFGGYGLGSKTNVHVDIRQKSNIQKPTIWWYSKKSWKEWGD